VVTLTRRETRLDDGRATGLNVGPIKELPMTTRTFWLLLVPLSLTATACPTRVVTYDDGGRDMRTAAGGNGGFGGRAAGGGAAGGGGKSDTGGQAGAVIAGTGGQAGSGGRAGVDGQTGAGGQAGAPGTGGAAGQAGSAGLGGAAGQAGASGSGGAPAKVKDGERCALSSDCASAVCTPFYIDLDGDTYGAGQAVGFCGTTPPVGYAIQSGDCCDTATNLAVAKQIHPGADFQTTSAGGVCNITWDYDCSGTVESNWQHCGACSDAPTCACAYTDWAESSCGRSEAQTPCAFVQAGPAMYCSQSPAGVGPVLCR
jgi:hypothetical protein